MFLPKKQQTRIRSQSSLPTKERKTKKLKKPSRPCFFCGVFQTKLTRHLKTRHKEETEIKQILQLPMKQQTKEFDNLRKKGIYRHNLKLLQSGHSTQNLEMKRRKINSTKAKKKLKMCTLWKAFVDTNYFFQHKKTCKQLHEFGSSSGVQGQFGLAPDLLRKFDEGDDEGFIDLLNRFSNDKKGTISRQNKMIVRFRCYLYKKNQRRKGKQVESLKVVMQNIRMLAGLYLKFEEIGTTKGAQELKN